MAQEAGLRGSLRFRFSARLPRKPRPPRASVYSSRSELLLRTAAERNNRRFRRSLALRVTNPAVKRALRAMARHCLVKARIQRGQRATGVYLRLAAGLATAETRAARRRGWDGLSTLWRPIGALHFERGTTSARGLRKQRACRARAALAADAHTGGWCEFVSYPPPDSIEKPQSRAFTRWQRTQLRRRRRMPRRREQRHGALRRIAPNTQPSCVACTRPPRPRRSCLPAGSQHRSATGGVLRASAGRCAHSTTAYIHLPDMHRTAAAEQRS